MREIAGTTVIRAYYGREAGAERETRPGTDGARPAA